LHPKLAEEDVAPLALLFDAYPATSRAISRLGQLENVRDTDTGKGYRHVTLSMRGLPDRLAEHHPELAKHLRKLGKIGRIDMRWVDQKSRTLMRWFVDSESLVMRAECYLKDGLVLPFSGGLVFDAEPVDLAAPEVRRTRTIVNGRFQMLGVVVKIENLKSDLWYEPHGTYARLHVSQTSMPKVEIEGAALGFLPTGLIDAFIPGNMHDLTLDFFRVATKGNDGKGVSFWIHVGAEQADSDGVLETGFDIEALDNSLVKMGVGMVNDRLVPRAEVIADSKALLSAIHAGFVQDLARLKTRVSGT
jgi:hypothetical protein